MGDTACQAALITIRSVAVLSLVTASLAAIFVEREVDEEERQIERDLMVRRSGAGEGNAAPVSRATGRSAPRRYSPCRR